MRDLDKERELLERAGLAETGSKGEALAVGDRVAALSTTAESLSPREAPKFRAGLATRGSGGEALAATAMGGKTVAVDAKPITKPAKACKSPVGGDPASAPTIPADDAIVELLRLGQEAAAHAEKLSKRVNPVEGRPDYPWRPNKLQLARNAAADMVERLLAFLDHCNGDPDLEEDDPGGGDPCDTDGVSGHGSETDFGPCERVSQLHLNGDDREDDDDGEPSLAVPEARQWDDQGKLWGAACRSRLRDEELEPNLGVPECPERHSQAATWAHAAIGLRAANDELERDLDIEEDDELDHKECGWEDYCEGDPDIDLREGDPFPYDPARRQVLSAPTDACIPAVKAALRDPKRRKDVIRPASSSNVGPIIASWRVE